jgi:hypothetical protein
MLDDIKDRYRPRRLEEIDDNGVSLINEPVAPDNVIPLPKARSLHATLCEALSNSRALLNRLENGICAPPGEAREVVRQLYVCTRQQVHALVAALEQDLE